MPNKGDAAKGAADIPINGVIELLAAAMLSEGDVPNGGADIRINGVIEVPAYGDACITRAGDGA